MLRQLVHIVTAALSTVHRKVKNVHLITWHEGTDGEQRYSSTLYLTEALDFGG
jgi:hypothetical protein